MNLPTNIQHSSNVDNVPIAPPPGLGPIHAGTLRRVQFHPSPPGLTHPSVLRNSLSNTQLNVPHNSTNVPNPIGTNQIGYPRPFPFPPPHPIPPPPGTLYLPGPYAPQNIPHMHAYPDMHSFPVPYAQQPPFVPLAAPQQFQPYSIPMNHQHTTYSNIMGPPPGLPYPPVAYSNVPASTETVVEQLPPTHNTRVHRDWVGKLAPLPGFTSPPTGLGPTPSKILIKSAVENGVSSRPAKQLPEPGQKIAPIGTSSSESTVSSHASQNPTTSNHASSSASHDPSLSPFSLSGSLSDINTSPDISFLPPSPSTEIADTFVPQYLKMVQNSCHQMKPLPPAPIFPSPSYMSTFLPQKLITEFESLEELDGHHEAFGHKSSLIASPAPHTDTGPALQPDTYHAHWRFQLGFELSQVAEDKARTVLWDSGICVWNFSDAEFTVSVPGIRENYPKLEPGDILHLREVMKNRTMISGQAFEGRITVLRKREGIVHFRADDLKAHLVLHVLPLKTVGFSESSRSHTTDPALSKGDAVPMFFNFTFLTNPRLFCDMDLTCQALSHDLSRKDEHHARRWLFPKHADVAAVYHLDVNVDEIEEDEWVDTGLNDEQKLSVSSIALRHWPVPYLISGPPGTGKTRTIVEAVLQILRSQPNACILLCAPSNPATDILAQRLSAHLNPKEMFRLNDITRTFAEVPISLSQYCYIENDRYGLPPWETLMAYKVVVCSCADAMILNAARCTNKALARLQESVYNGLFPRATKKPTRPHWTHLLIDEAAQGLETELAIPISTMLTHQPIPDDEHGLEMDFKDGIVSPQLVLCGDPNQLGPIVSSEHALAGGLNVSLLERLFQRPLYAQSDFARSKMAANNYVQRERTGAVPFTNLVKNYRSHPAILMTPSALFYNDTLEPCALDNGFVHWNGLANRHMPLKFVGHDTPEDCNDEVSLRLYFVLSSSNLELLRVNFFNLGDIDRIVETCQSLLSASTTAEPALQASQIGVIAPWREQVWRIRERLRKEKFGDVDVGTVEDYQGRESRVIILSCVRSNPRFLREDEEKGVGLVFERKRMNVAVTRAKELLVIIGNGKFLMRDPYWRSYLEFALRNKLYVGPQLDIAADASYISRLESVYMKTPGTEIDLDEDELTLRLAGDLAREVLKD